uniref:Uncharacterized protein n=1 Tax=Cynoglossus semilaevis TaxID=244447 RepID=A0A3P8WG08_CYNSE
MEVTTTSTRIEYYCYLLSLAPINCVAFHPDDGLKLSASERHNQVN